MPPAEETDIYFLEGAVEVLQRRFGRLTAGDLIAGLTGAAASIRAQGGIIRPAAPGDAEADDSHDGGEHPHGYWEAGDY